MFFFFQTELISRLISRLLFYNTSSPCFPIMILWSFLHFVYSFWTEQNIMPNYGAADCSISLLSFFSLLELLLNGNWDQKPLLAITAGWSYFKNAAKLQETLKHFQSELIVHFGSNLKPNMSLLFHLHPLQKADWAVSCVLFTMAIMRQFGLLVWKNYLQQVSWREVNLTTCWHCLQLWIVRSSCIYRAEACMTVFVKL